MWSKYGKQVECFYGHQPENAVRSRGFYSYENLALVVFFCTANALTALLSTHSAPQRSLQHSSRIRFVSSYKPSINVRHPVRKSSFTFKGETDILSVLVPLYLL